MEGPLFSFAHERLRLVDEEERPGEDRAEHHEERELPHDSVSSAITDFTNASNSSTDPVFL